MHTATIRKFGGHVKDLGTDSRRIRFVATHERPDRDSQVILLNGLDTTNFMKNPIMLIQHDWQSRAVARVESLRIQHIDGFQALVGVATFPNRPASTEALEDVRAGLYNSVSVGLLMHEYGPPVMEGQKGLTITKSELVEISLVSIPSCASCSILEKEHTPMHTCQCERSHDRRARKTWDDFDLEIIPDDSSEELEIIADPKADRLIEIDDNTYRMAMNALPGIVRAGLRVALEAEVQTALNRLRGRVD
jgi:hypothetical protein